MSKFDVTTSTGSYPVIIAEGAFREELASGGHDLVLADRFFADTLADAPVPTVFVDANEERKNLFEVDRILGEFSEHRLTRGGSVIALGGGIVQDLGTMAASVYMRGIAWTYAPTTLMSMADSCIGGKSSLNVSGTKNLAGNIYPPSSVVVDPEFIATLDAENVVAGLGEAVKIAFCAGPRAFDAYLRHFADRAHWEPLIEGVLTAKKWFIETDEFDRAERRLLNFGHTFGHALETATDFSVNHGVAIVVGMLAAISLRSRMFAVTGAGKPLEEHCQVILGEVPDLGPRLARVDIERFRAAFLKDKKHPADALRVVLPKSDVIGVEEVSLPRTAEVLDEVDAALMTAIGMAA
jgi:3-dehydroquinate synthase